MTDRATAFERILRPERGQTTLLVVDMQHATLDIIRRAYGRVIPAKAVADELSQW
jgi:hypothetical protein